MKMKLNKWIGLSAGVLVLGLTSCIKDKGYSNETDFSSLQDHVVFVKGGLAYFSAANVAFNNGDTTTVTVTVNLASVDLPTSPVKVTFAIDAPKIADYNTANGTAFQLAPDTSFSIASTEVTIPAGQQYATTTITFYKGAFDPAVSYLLPITITDASGKALTSNFNTLYYNVIGNPLAGLYSDVGYLYHPTGPRAIPAGFKTISAVSSTILQVDLGDLGGAGYIAWFTVDPTTNAVTIQDPTDYYNTSNNFLVQFNHLADAAPPGYTPQWAGSPLCNNVYDPATKTLYLRYGYLGGGGYRVTEEILVKQ